MTLPVSYAGMNSYLMGQTIDLSQASLPAYESSLLPYRNWGRILSSKNLGFANHQTLESELHKIFSHGLFFQASHTWAKNLSNVGADAPTAFSPEVIYGTPVGDSASLRLNRGDVAGTAQSLEFRRAAQEVKPGVDLQRILVNVTADASTAALLRRARRLAHFLHTECAAVCVHSKAAFTALPLRFCDCRQQLWPVRSAALLARLNLGKFRQNREVFCYPSHGLSLDF